MRRRSAPDRPAVRRSTPPARGRVVPRPGQTIVIDPSGSGLAGGPVRMRLTRTVEPLSSPGTVGGDPAHARWWLVTGWRLTGDGRRGLLCTLTVRPGTVRIEPAAPRASARTLTAGSSRSFAGRTGAAHSTTSRPARPTPQR